MKNVPNSLKIYTSSEIRIVYKLSNVTISEAADYLLGLPGLQLEKQEK